ncbi:MAG: hypothetical protein GY870_16385 [archaeon]|nr:hypothetical protein [archaeon]
MAKRRTRKMVRVTVDKHAKGESFSKELEKAGRYMVGISLVSLKTIGKYDMDRNNEFYFKIDGGKAFNSRVPNKGNIELRENQVFNSKSDTFTLWSEFARFKKGQDKIVKVKITLKEDDPGLSDDVLGSQEFEIKCPQATKYVILNSKDEKTKAKLKVFAKKTLY